METQNFGTVAISVTAVAVLVITANYFLGPTYDPREPPVIHQKVPYIGHVIGLLQYGLRYFELLSTKYPLPVFTLQTLGRKVYVVNSPDLISAVQKNAKTLTFDPFVSFVSPRIFDAGDHAMAVINDNLDGEKGQWGLLSDVSRGMHTALAPGESLDWMTRTMLNKLEESIEPLGENDDGTEIDLYRWVRKAFTVAGTEAVSMYRPRVDTWRQLISACRFTAPKTPSTTIQNLKTPSARKGCKARNKFIAALKEYVNDNGPETGSDLIKVRYEGNKKYGVAEYTANFEIGNLIGVLINATPTFFWILTHIYSRPTLLAQLRAEIANVTDSATSGHITTNSIIVSKFQPHCPLLLSTYQETLRLQTHNTSSRWVTKDTVLADQYLLKAGNVIQMPGYPVHTLPSIWGPDVTSFNPHRFLKPERKDKSTKQHPASFRSFGGGATLCPGRHFAAAEICAAAAMMVSRFEIEPVGTGGEWSVPDWMKGKVASGIPPPEQDIRVRVRVREETKGVRWRFGYEGSVGKFEVFGG
ncbi:MAG: hypothetical protein Q9200_005608 [Gallowayella weberi]